MTTLRGDMALQRDAAEVKDLRCTFEKGGTFKLLLEGRRHSSLQGRPLPLRDRIEIAPAAPLPGSAQVPIHARDEETATLSIFDR